MKETLKARIYYFFTYAEFNSARVFLALSSALWAIMLFMPGLSFDRPTYKIMSEIANEYVWASAFLISSILTLYDVVRKDDNKYLCIFDATLSFLLWTVSAICMTISVFPVPAAIAPHIAGALVTWWVLIRTDFKYD